MPYTLPYHCKIKKIGKVIRLISTARLNILLCLYLQPINQVIFLESYFPTNREGKFNLEASFELRCFQRLSQPNIATQLCHWHDNWRTIGSFTPVLSY